MKPPLLVFALILACAPLRAAQAGAADLKRLSDRIETILGEGPAAAQTLPAEERNSLAEEARKGLQEIRAGKIAAGPDSARAAEIFEKFLAQTSPLPPGLRQSAAKAEADGERIERGQLQAPAFWDGGSRASAEAPGPKGRFSGVLQRIYHPAEGEHTKWQHAPIKLVSYPVTKALYDVPNMATSLVTESVTRSPLHNFLGALSTFRGAIKAAVGGLWRMIKGVLNPKNASLIDGSLQAADSGVTAVKGALGLAKAGASLLGYPVYRLLGGRKSVYAPLRSRGKRAAIVFIGSQAPSVLGTIVDGYKEQVARYHLARIADYYCAVSWNNKVAGKLADCLEKMPKDTVTVDFIALLPGGGSDAVDRTIARGLPAGKPGLIISVGHYDDPSAAAGPENAMGQKGLSWAVHFYLSGLMDKRLRGIPLRQAAMQAYNEGRVINAIDPISLAALAAIGYQGSKPDFRPAN